MELLIELVQRDLKAKYKNTFLGILWVILQPLLLAIFFVFISNKLLSNLHEYRIDYLSMYAVLIPWQFFATAFQRSVSSIELTNHLIYRVKFPLILLPLSVILSSFVDMLINVLVFLLLVLFLKKIILFNIVTFILILLFGSLFIISLSILFSMLVCFVGDIRHVVPYLIKLSLFALPILYNTDAIPSNVRYYYEHIPLVWMISNVKELVTGNFKLTTYLDANVLLLSVTSFLIAYFLFKRLERFIVDYI